MPTAPAHEAAAPALGIGWRAPHQRALLDQATLRAPFAGIVAQINGEVGEFVTPSPPGIPTPPAVDLIDDSCLYVEAPIDEVDAARVKSGMPVRISLDAFRGQSFAGTVTRILVESGTPVEFGEPLMIVE